VVQQIVGAGLLLLAFTAAVPAAADAQIIKLATLVPEGSVWDKRLREMGADWQAASDGRIRLRIYPGGVAGADSDVIRKMRIGQLHAGALTVTGLTEIDSGFEVFGIPLFLKSYEELFFVIDRLEPVLRSRLEENGFALINWGYGGWAHFFSKKPVQNIEDLRSLKIFTSAGDDKMVQWWKDRGFHPVALAATDILTALQTGMIEGLPTPPLAALSLQWFRQTPYMHGLGLGPLIGATVVTNRTWSRLSETDQQALLVAAKRMDDRLREEIPKLEQEAIEEMSRRGLSVTSSDDPAEWEAAAQEFAETTRGGGVPKEIFDLAIAARDEYRQSTAAAAATP